MSWIKTSEKLPDFLETVWISNGKGWTALGCLTNQSLWAVSNGIIYEENGQIVSECELDDDYEVHFWHPLPKPPKPL